MSSGPTSSLSKQEAIKTPICSRTRKRLEGEEGPLSAAARLYLFVSGRKLVFKVSGRSR